MLPQKPESRNISERTFFIIIGNFVYLPCPYGAEAKGRWVWNLESVRCTVFGSYARKVLSFSLFLQYPNVMIF
ncbi:hypothetical protein DXA74_09325 [Bacteroides sp. OF04-15BH]|nr:hypothetical protein DXA74_09325 [Bacteroides sp. OF04-15BH]